MLETGSCSLGGNESRYEPTHIRAIGRRGGECDVGVGACQNDGDVHWPGAVWRWCHDCYRRDLRQRSDVYHHCVSLR